MNWHRFRKVFWLLDDLKSQTWLRKWVPRHKGLEQQNLNEYQVYPVGGNLDLSFLTQPDNSGKRLIDRSTPISSMGSCFALEIRARLLDRKYNFVNTEPSEAGSAKWGRVYTTKNMLQIFQYSLSTFEPKMRFAHSSKGVIDPYREGFYYNDKAEAETAIAEHLVHSRAALTDCEVLILTVGQNETWVNLSDGTAWAHKPPPDIVARYGQDQFVLKQFSLEENIENLAEILRLFWENNPAAKVIFTVSPVPSYATFYDMNVAVRSFENKAVLLLAIKDIVSKHSDQCFYFPSFEMAIISNNPSMQLDNRHVRPRLVEKIMDRFDDSFTVSQ